MSDIVERLRKWAIEVTAVPASDLMDEAADEIERLRGYRDAAEADAAVARMLVDRLRFTEAERDTLRWAIGWCRGLNEARCAVLEELLERLGGGR